MNKALRCGETYAVLGDNQAPLRWERGRRARWKADGAMLARAAPSDHDVTKGSVSPTSRAAVSTMCFTAVTVGRSSRLPLTACTRSQPRSNGTVCW